MVGRIAVEERRCETERLRVLRHARPERLERKHPDTRHERERPLDVELRVGDLGTVDDVAVCLAAELAEVVGRAEGEVEVAGGDRVPGAPNHCGLADEPDELVDDVGAATRAGGLQDLGVATLAASEQRIVWVVSTAARAAHLTG